MDTSTLIVVGTALVGVATGALMALKAVAPHTATLVDDEIVEYGEEKVLPVMVRVLERLRGSK